MGREGGRERERERGSKERRKQAASCRAAVVCYVGQPNACNETGTLLALNSTPPPPITPLSQAKNRLVGVARMSATTELDGCF